MECARDLVWPQLVKHCSAISAFRQTRQRFPEVTLSFWKRSTWVISDPRIRFIFLLHK